MGTPILLSLICIFGLVVIIKETSIIELLGKCQSDSPLLLEELKKVYHLKEPMTYEKLAVKLKYETKPKETNPTGIM